MSSNAPSTSDTSTSGSNASLSSFGVWIAGWILVIAVLFGLTRFTWGTAIVYYSIWLSIVLVLVTHADSITGILQQANITQGQS